MSRCTTCNWWTIPINLMTHLMSSATAGSGACSSITNAARLDHQLIHSRPRFHIERLSQNPCAADLGIGCTDNANTAFLNLRCPNTSRIQMTIYLYSLRIKKAPRRCAGLRKRVEVQAVFCRVFYLGFATGVRRFFPQIK